MNKGGSHQECTVIVSLIGPVISELCVGVCIIRSVNQLNKRCIYSDSSKWVLFAFVLMKYVLFYNSEAVILFTSHSSACQSKIKNSYSVMGN